jgi:hypothetical protein
VFPSVEPGDYTLKVERDRFKALEKTGITLQTGERASLGTLGLSVGDVTQTVSVTAETTTVNTEDAAHTDFITSEQVETQLMFGRNIASLAQLLPGISSGSADPSLDRSGGTFSSQGGRTDTNNFSVDGINSTDIDNGGDIKMQQSADAISEVTVLQNNYQAEYANGAGAMVVEVTKSGTKDFHGGVNYYTKNEFFDDIGYFEKRDGQTRPDVDRLHNINYLIGGPVILPHFNRNRDKLFFFWAQEFWPNSASNAYTMTVPTDLERGGDFSQSYQPDGVTLRVVTDPTTGKPFPENKIPSYRFDNNGQAILGIFPHANFTNHAISGGQYNYVGRGTYTSPTETRTLRIDYNKSSQDRFSFTWTGFQEEQEGFNGATASWFGGFQWPFANVKFTANNNGISGRWTHTLSSITVNEAAFSWQGNPEKGVATDDAPLQSTYKLNLPMLTTAGNPLAYVPQLNFGGIPNDATVGADGGYFWLPYNAPDNVYNWTDKLSSLRGTHFLKIGVEVMRFWRGIPSNSERFGDYDFTPSSLNPLDTGYAYSNTILGNFNTYEETNGIPVQNSVGGNYNLFVQDTWKVLPRLTLDYGIRLSDYIPVFPGDNRWAAFYPDAYNPSQAVKLLQPGTNASGQRVAVNPVTGQEYSQAVIGAIAPNVGTMFEGMVSPLLNSGIPRGATDSRGVQLAPRFGFNWGLFGSEKTVLRGGIGFFYSPVPIDNYRSRANQPPLFKQPELFYGTIKTLTSGSQFTFPESVLGDTFNDKLPISMNVNLGVQRDIGHGIIVEVAYVAALDRHLLNQRNLNSIPFGADFLAANQDPTTGSALPSVLLRPIPGYGDIQMQEYAGSSNYNSMQVTVNRRQGKWLTYGANYTWAKALDYGSSDGAQLSTLAPTRTFNYGRADFDQPQALKANWLWSLPSVPLTNYTAKEVLNNWQLSGSAFFISGTPIAPANGPAGGWDDVMGFNTTNPIDITGSPTDGARINITGNPSISRGSRTFSRNFNTAAFSLPAVGTYGNSVRNPLLGPGSQTWNLALLKTFAITEKAHLEVRWETYNTFNHTNFSSFDTNAVFNTSGTPATNANWGQQMNTDFGAYTAALAPRKMQLGARFSF